MDRKIEREMNIKIDRRKMDRKKDGQKDGQINKTFKKGEILLINFTPIL